jgi:hypothetical protein
VRRKLLDWFVKWGFVLWVNDQLYKRVGFIRVLFRNEFPFFVEGMYVEKFVWV